MLEKKVKKKKKKLLDVIAAEFVVSHSRHNLQKHIHYSSKIYHLEDVLQWRLDSNIKSKSLNKYFI